MVIFVEFYFSRANLITFSICCTLFFKNFCIFCQNKEENALKSKKLKEFVVFKLQL